MNKTNYKKYHRDNTYLENESLFRNIFQKRYNLISKFIKSPSKVLDIGCSNGVFLDLYIESETWGVEPSQNAHKINKKHKVIKSTFEIAKLPLNYFDLVIMNHTLEHLKRPSDVLTKIKSLLKKDGIVFIDVPNVGSLSSKILGNKWPYLLPDEHLWQFDKKSITKLARDAGFEVLHWESRSGIFEYANPLKELKRKRFLLDIITIPYSLIATLFNMGDSMSLIAKRN
jgi:SAM-dependent methyltransferase